MLQPYLIGDKLFLVIILSPCSKVRRLPMKLKMTCCARELIETSGNGELGAQRNFMMLQIMFN